MTFLSNRELVIYPDGRMDAKNAALYLGFSVKTLATMRCQGTGPQFMKMGRIYYYQQHLDEWLAQFQACTSTGQAKLIPTRLTKELPRKESKLKTKGLQRERE